jgi:hypothetical protein
MAREYNKDEFEKEVEKINMLLASLVIQDGMPIELILAAILETFMTITISIALEEEGHDIKDITELEKMANEMERKAEKLNVEMKKIESNDTIQRLLASRLLMSTFTKLKKNSPKIDINIDTNKIPKYDPNLDGPNETFSIEDILRGFDEDE